MTSRTALLAKPLLSLSSIIALAFLWHCLHDQQSEAEAKSNTVDESVERELIRIVKKQSDAWNRGDITEFMSAYWKDARLTFSSSGKTHRGWDVTLANYEKNYPDRETMGKLTFSEFETQELGADAMLMLGRWHLDRTESIGGNFTLVWKRINNQWLIVHDHSSSLKNEVK